MNVKMEKLIVSSSPHIHTDNTVSKVMGDVLIALVPACIAGVLFFGFRSAVVILTAVAACIIFEWLFQKATHRETTVSDLSAAVTGVLLGLNLPVSIPLWMVLVGSAFAIIIVKQLYGGLGKNFLNPALAGRCFMLIAWAGAMTAFTPAAFSGVDAVTSATPLAIMKNGAEGVMPSLMMAFLGAKGGSIGETSGLCLLIGFIYLLVRRVIDCRISLTYILSFAILTFLFGNNGNMSKLYYTAMQVLTGGLLLGAFFMATDYVTTPTTPKGHIIFGLGCGILTFLIRRFGGYPEGVSFSILLMNVASPLIETATMPKVFGTEGGKSK
ncbi:MAG: RnfABCDGE type electron transport complex subunit D [Clostridia bacterium]|nr:RnfABCDGE type electron transport complex subunit D [Clostridia bacterium]